MIDNWRDEESPRCLECLQISLFATTLYSTSARSCDLFKSWGILPAAVVGHSSGEIAAAYTAGLLSFEHVVIVAYYRGLFMNLTMLDAVQISAGGMCAVGMSQSVALQLLEQYKGRVELAAVISPNSCTVSGDTDAINEIERSCVESAIFCRKLRVDVGEKVASRWLGFADQPY